MPKKKTRKKEFTVSATVTVSLIKTVQASSIDEALRSAAELSLPSLCHQCSSSDEPDVWSLTGELDGEPEVFEVEDEDGNVNNF